MIKHGEGFDELGTDLIRVQVHGSTGTVSLQRPAKRNALSQRMLGQLQTALQDLHQEKRVRAVILTGIGDAFSAGSDLFEIQETMSMPDAQARWFADCVAQKDLIELMLRYPKPIIAAVNGPALGFGAAMVLAADMAVASESALFGFPEVHRGLVAGLAAPLLSFRLGAATAADLLLRGATISSELCDQLGIFRWVVSEDLVWAKADAVAQQLATTAAESIAMTKRLINETVGEQLLLQLSAGAAATATARTTDTAGEGVRAFLEKREPDWP